MFFPLKKGGIQLPFFLTFNIIVLYYICCVKNKVAL